MNTETAPWHITPWGISTRSEQIAPGIWWITTPSHGGYYLEPPINALIPDAWKAATFNLLGKRGYYEEDVDCSMVVRFFPRLFKREARDLADAAFCCQFARLVDRS